MEYKWFDSLDEVSEHNNEESCYVVYDSMVFDVTDTLGDLDFVSIEDCGNEIMLSEQEWVGFYDVNIGGYLGAILPDDAWETEDAEVSEIVDPFLMEEGQGVFASESMQEEPSPLVETETVVMVGVGLLIVVVVAIIFFSLKKRSKN